MTLVYLSPPNLLKKAVGQFASWYMSPLFYQNWHLFSPNPGISSTKLAVRCKQQEAGWSNWGDPLENLYAFHYRYRISGYGKLIYIYREIGIGLEQEFRKSQGQCFEGLARSGEADGNRCKTEQIVRQLEKTSAYALANRYAHQTCRASMVDQNDHLDQVQFKILVFYPLEYSERYQAGKRWSSVEEVLFPPVDLGAAGQ